MDINLFIFAELKKNKMKVKCRLTHNLAEIKVDEIETTLFKSHPKEIEDTIINLLDIIEDLAKLIEKDFSYSFFESNQAE
jgi:hypothetical protein